MLIENRNGLVVDCELLQANGTAERDAAMVLLERVGGCHRVTVGADKGYDTKDFVAEARQMNVTPHVARNEKGPGGSAMGFGFLESLSRLCLGVDEFPRSHRHGINSRFSSAAFFSRVDDPISGFRAAPALLLRVLSEGSDYLGVT